MGLLEQIVTVEALERESTRRTIFRENPLRLPMKRDIDQLELQGQGLEARLIKWNAEIDTKSARHLAQVANWNDLLRLHKAWEHSGEELDEASTRLRIANSKIATYSAVQGEPYRIAEPPRAPLEPTEPSPLIIILSSLLGGLAFGLAVAFLAEFSKSCFRSVGDVSRVMGVPILGVVNLIQTRADVRRRRFKRLVIGGSTAMLLGCLGWFTYAWSYDQAQLPTRVVQVVEDFRLSLR